MTRSPFSLLSHLAGDDEQLEIFSEQVLRGELARRRAGAGTRPRPSTAS